MIHARHLLGDPREPRHHRVGALERRRRREIHESDRVALVLGRHEAGRTRRHERVDGDEQRAERQHHHRSVALHDRDRVHIPIARALEQSVERREDATERSAVRVRLDAPEQERRHRGRERQREDRRQNHRDGQRQRELFVELAREAAEERDRHEHRGEHQRDCDHGAAHVGNRRFGSLERRHRSVIEPFLHRLDHHDCVVDDDADREHDAEERERVDRKSKRSECSKCADERDRNHQDRNQRGAPALQE